ncbi:hypothetical protein GCM10027295_07670 [Pseudaeromonas pectinilytica]
MLSLQQRQEIHSALALCRAEPGEELVAYLRDIAIFALMPGTTVIHCHVAMRQTR